MELYVSYDIVHNIYFSYDTVHISVQQRPDFTTVSEKMSCNYCNAEFEAREDQVNHL